jgi:hypothetical protein
MNLLTGCSVNKTTYKYYVSLTTRLKRKKRMKVNRVIQLDNGAVQFNGELSEKETDLVIELGLNYLIRAGAFPAVTAALQGAQKEEEAAQGYAFPEDMTKSD